MPWPQGTHELPSWQDRAEFFVSLKRPAEDVEAEKFADRAGISYDELSKVAEASGCSTSEALDGLTMYSCAIVKKASGLQLPRNEEDFLRGMQKEALKGGAGLAQWLKNEPDRITRIIGAIIGGTAGVASMQGLGKRRGGKPSRWERFAEKSLLGFNKKNPDPASYSKKLTKALLGLQKEVSEASADHPAAATFTAALIGAAQGQSFAGAAFAGKKIGDKLGDRINDFKAAKGI